MTVFRVSARFLLLLCLFVPGLLFAEQPPVLSGEREILMRVLKDRQFDALESYLGDRQSTFERLLRGEVALERSFGVFENADPALTPLLDAWREHHPQSYAAQTATGLHYLALSWAWRGHRVIRRTHPYRITQMEHHLAVAYELLNRSLTMTGIPVVSLTALIEIEKMSGSRTTAEKWLQQAETVLPSNRGPRSMYMSLLEPRWGGSHAEMDAFAAHVASVAPDRATKEFAKYLAARSLGDKALGRWESGDRAGALKLYEEAELLAGSDSFSAPRAKILSEVGQLEAALVRYNGILAANPDDRAARHERGNLLFRLRRVPEGLADLREAAEAGDVDAWTQLGLILIHGEHGVKIDDKEGNQWLARAATYWHRKATVSLGHNYVNGVGFPVDYGKAAALYRIAAEQEHGGAQNELGLLYWYGRGVPQNQDEAIRLWQSAKEKGIWQAKHNLNYFLTSGQRAKLLVENPEDIPEMLRQRWVEATGILLAIVLAGIFLVIRRRRFSATPA